MIPEQVRKGRAESPFHVLEAFRAFRLCSGERLDNGQPFSVRENKCELDRA